MGEGPNLALNGWIQVSFLREGRVLLKTMFNKGRRYPIYINFLVQNAIVTEFLESMPYISKHSWEGECG